MSACTQSQILYHLQGAGVKSHTGFNSGKGNFVDRQTTPVLPEEKTTEEKPSDSNNNPDKAVEKTPVVTLETPKASQVLGQPKLFGGFGFKLYSIIWPKRRVHAKFGIIRKPLRCATRPLKCGIFTLWISDFKDSNAKLRWTTIVSKIWLALYFLAKKLNGF